MMIFPHITDNLENSDLISVTFLLSVAPLQKMKKMKANKFKADINCMYFA